MKPHITIFLTGIWMCEGGEVIGFGNTPSVAFSAWYQMRILSGGRG